MPGRCYSCPLKPARVLPGTPVDTGQDILCPDTNGRRSRWVIQQFGKCGDRRICFWGKCYQRQHATICAEVLVLVRELREGLNTFLTRSQTFTQLTIPRQRTIPSPVQDV